MKNIILFLNENTGIAIFISVISTCLSFYYNYRSQVQYRKSQEPFISLKLEKEKGLIYLVLINTGKTPAKKLKLDIKNIENNGPNELMLDKVWSQTFELYPGESIRGMVAISGQSLATGFLYPTLSLNISYTIGGRKTKEVYDRTITLSTVFNHKIHADVSLDLSKIESKMNSSAKAIVRIANYLDGHQVAEFDELNILANKSLKKDLIDVLEGNQDDGLVSREDTIGNNSSNF